MKTLILITLMLPLIVQAQEKKWSHIGGNDITIMSLQFTSGSADAFHEVLVNHPHTFERVAGWDRDYWLPKYSWHNKEHTWTPISDGYHLTASINRVFNYASIAISTGDLFSYQKKDRWKILAKKFVMSYVANRIGFIIVDRVIFNDHIERQKAGLEPR